MSAQRGREHPAPIPVRRLYEPTWWERRFPWIQEFLIRLDPEPLADRLRPLVRPFWAVVEHACFPLDAALGALAGIVRAFWGGLHEGVALGMRALPLPGFVKGWLWLRPVTLKDLELDSAQMVLRRQSAVLRPVALMAAVLLHFAVLSFWPELRAAELITSTSPLVAVEIPPEIEIPPPPAGIARPATPALATADIEEDVTIQPTTFEANPVAALPPPPEAPEAEVSDGPTFTPFTVPPTVLSMEEVRRLLREHYPAPLHSAGVGGVVVVWAYVDGEGVVQEVRLAGTSGHTSLDEAAMRVVERIRFSPAIHRDITVPVWIQLPLEFDVR